MDSTIDRQNFKVFSPFERVLASACLNSYDSLMRSRVGETLQFKNGS